MNIMVSFMGFNFWSDVLLSRFYTWLSYSHIFLLCGNNGSFNVHTYIKKKKLDICNYNHKRSDYIIHCSIDFKLNSLAELTKNWPSQHFFYLYPRISFDSMGFSLHVTPANQHFLAAFQVRPNISYTARWKLRNRDLPTREWNCIVHHCQCCNRDDCITKRRFCRIRIHRLSSLQHRFHYEDINVINIYLYRGWICERFSVTRKCVINVGYFKYIGFILRGEKNLVELAWQ